MTRSIRSYSKLERRFVVDRRLKDGEKLDTKGLGYWAARDYSPAIQHDIQAAELAKKLKIELPKEQ